MSSASVFGLASGKRLFLAASHSRSAWPQRSTETDQQRRDACAGPFRVGPNLRQ
jgi:hypothetical protein